MAARDGLDGYLLPFNRRFVQKQIETPVSTDMRPALTVRAPGGANHFALTLRRLL